MESKIIIKLFHRVTRGLNLQELRHTPSGIPALNLMMPNYSQHTSTTSDLLILNLLTFVASSFLPSFPGKYIFYPSESL